MVAIRLQLRQLQLLRRRYLKVIMRCGPIFRFRIQRLWVRAFLSSPPCPQLKYYNTNNTINIIINNLPRPSTLILRAT